ncbi:MAG: CoA transferase subunit A [Promethearchaeota archaeon]
MPQSSKFIPFKQLIRKFIPNGSHVYLEGLLINRLPMAVIHELIRAKVRNLRVVSAPNGLAIDQLIGAGCIAELEFYFLGFMTQDGFATMHRFRDATEQGSIQVKESMGYAICMALRAGAYGIPFIPLPDFRGSDLLSIRNDYQIMQSPYDPNNTVITVPALRPDVLILHAHAADSRGNVFLDEPWTAFTLTTAQACRKVVVTVEDILEPDTLDPSRIAIPHFLVDAISQVPYGAAPTALNHRYEVDKAHISVYLEKAKTVEGFDQYRDEYIIACSDHAAFIQKTGFPPPWKFRDNEGALREGDR